MSYDLRLNNRIKILISLVTFIFISGCSYLSKDKKNNNFSLNERNVNQFSNKSLNNTQHQVDVFDQKFIEEFKNIIKEDVTVSNSFANELDILSSVSESSDIELKYKTIHDLLKKLPRAWTVKPYKLKYENLVDNLKNFYEETSTEVPKVMHFVWIGGPLGEIQKDYIKIWAQMNPDYMINIWYDSTNLFAYETKNSMKEYLSLSLFQDKKAKNYEKIFAESLIKLQDELYSYLDSEKKRDSSLTKDKIRVDFIDKKIYKKSTVKIAENKYKDNLRKLENDKETLPKKFSNIHFKNINEEIQNWSLKEFYEQELNLRANFAAASDSVRLEILRQYGSIYIDVDLLPAMKPINDLIEKYSELKASFAIPLQYINLAFLEELLINQRELIPSSNENSRKYVNSLKNRIDLIKNSNNVEDKFKENVKNLNEEIIELARDKKYSEIKNVFFNKGSLKVREGEFKVLKSNNAFIASHPVKNKTYWIQQLIDKISDNYMQINSLEKNNPGLKLPYKRFENISEKIAHDFRSDGLIIGHHTTITVSGPTVYNRFLESVNKFDFLTNFDFFNEFFNPFTPENEISSWFKRTAENYMNPKRTIVQIGNEENTKISAENIFNKYKESSDLYLLKNGKFKKIQVNVEKDDKFISPEIDSSKVNLHLVGHAEVVDKDNIAIGGLNPVELATKIKQYLFNEGVNDQLEYISIVSCNPTGDPNDTNLIETFSRKLLDKLNELGVSVKIASVRTTFVKVAKNGEKQYLHGDSYTGHREGDKLFVFRKGEGEFYTVKAKFLLEQLNSENVTETKNFFSSMSAEERELFEKGSSGPLGDITKVMKSLQNAYEIQSLSNSLAVKAKVATEELRLSHGMIDDFAPFFPSLNQEQKTINFVNTKTGEFRKNIPLTEPVINDFNSIWNKLNSEMRNLRSLPIITDRDGIIQPFASGAEGLGITPLLMAQTLFSAFKNLNTQTNVSSDQALSKTIQIQTYIFYSQIGVDIFSKLNQIEIIVSNLIHTKIFEEEETLFPKINNVLGKLNDARYVGVGFGIANVTLDAFEYSYANGLQKSVFATQLSLDSINASMTLASLALGDGVASSVLGYLGTPLAGLAIGFTGFATAAVEAQDESLQIAKFFNEYQKDHYKVGDLSTCSLDSNVISLAHSSYTKNEDSSCTGNLNSSVIKVVDLTTDNNMKITYGSHFMYKTKNWDKSFGNFYYSNLQGSANFPETNQAELFNIRETLNIPSTFNLSLSQDAVIVLPLLMEKIISYSYSYTPGIMTRYDNDLTAVNSLAINKTAQFVFRYFVDLFEYAIRKLSFETKNTEIKIILGTQNRTLVSPSIPMLYKNKISYNIEGGHGKYSLLLSKNATYNIAVNDDEEWIIDAVSLSRKIQFIEKGKIKFGDDLKVNISGNYPKEITIKEEGKIYITRLPRIFNYGFIKFCEKINWIDCLKYKTNLLL